MTLDKTKVVYQVYPKSFKDSNGDGIGDIPGVIEKLPYLAELGIDMIWLNPFYPSPQKDNGYDVADYCAIDPTFGSMADVERLIEVAASYKIDIMLDMVFNHTSTEHEWFQKALAGDKFYQDFYYIRDPKPDGSLPTNWESKFERKAWAPFGDTGKYYLSLYDETQADLDWHNPHVRKALTEVLNFWLDKGVKGFRFDVLNVIGKDEVLVDSTEGISQEKALYTDTPVVHDYIHYINRESFGDREGFMTVGEMSSTTVENGVKYTAPDREELAMIFSFHHLKVDYVDGQKWSSKPFDFLELKTILDQWQRGMSEGNGWNAVFWNNHDQPRANTRFADPVNYPYESATMLAQTVHFLRGTPYIYQGEEIGMTDPGFEAITDYMDIETQNAYKRLLEAGVDHDTAMTYIKEKSRDNSRTPMQWDDSPNAGFTTGTPWLKVADNYPSINVKQELSSGKIFKYYQALIRLRKTHPIIAEGSYCGIQMDHPSIYAYLREYQGQTLLVLNNFYGQATEIDLSSEDLPWTQANYFFGNYERTDVLSAKLTLAPYETLAIYFKN